MVFPVCSLVMKELYNMYIACAKEFCILCTGPDGRRDRHGRALRAPARGPYRARVRDRRGGLRHLWLEPQHLRLERERQRALLLPQGEGLRRRVRGAPGVAL